MDSIERAKSRAASVILSALDEVYHIIGSSSDFADLETKMCLLQDRICQDLRTIVLEELDRKQSDGQAEPQQLEPGDTTD